MATATSSSRSSLRNLVVIPPHRVDEPERVGEILEVVGERGHERYQVRWEDGEDEILDLLPGHATIRNRTPRG
jgi:hypothetical protein